jgi:hypothetical protein
MPFSTVNVWVVVPANQRRVSERMRETLATIRRRVHAEPVRDRVRYVGLVFAVDTVSLGCP